MLRMTGSSEMGKFRAVQVGNFWKVEVSGLINATFTMTDEQVRKMALNALGL